LKNEQNTSRGHRFGYHLLVCGRVAAWKSGNHRQRPGKSDDTQLRGVHRLGKADRRCRQESGTQKRQKLIVITFKYHK